MLERFGVARKADRGGCAGFHAQKEGVVGVIAVHLAVNLREGAAQAIPLIKTILPTLAVFSAAMALFRFSGAFDLLSSFLTPAFNILGVDPALVPLLVVRPFSGSAALAALVAGSTLWLLVTFLRKARGKRRAYVRRSVKKVKRYFVLATLAN